MAGEAEGGYRETYAFYARRYGKGERSVKRWVAWGREKGARCPLDEPGALRSWWEKWMTHKVPDGILAACAEAGELLDLPKQPVKVVPLPVKAGGDDGAGLETGAPGAGGVAAGDAPPPREMKAVADEERGIAQELRRAEERAWHAHQAWLEAMKTGDEGKISFSNRQVAAAAENVRKIQKDATDEAIRMRVLIPRLEAEQVMGEFGMDLLARVKGMVEGMAKALGLPLTRQIEVAWSAEVEALCAVLQADVFGEEVEG